MSIMLIWRIVWATIEFSHLVGVAITALGYLLSLVLIRWVLLTRKRNPTASAAW